MSAGRDGMVAGIRQAYMGTGVSARCDTSRGVCVVLVRLPESESVVGLPVDRKELRGIGLLVLLALLT